MKRAIWKIKIWGNKIIRLPLQAAFGFDRWHIFSLTEKQYAKDIISYCNGRQLRNSFAEIGCGLGDIVRRVRYKDRVGYDMDDKVLRAAAFLNAIHFGGRLRLERFHFPDSKLAGRKDVIVLVNWIHLIAPALLKEQLEKYFRDSLETGGEIIIDTVQDKEYEFNHSIAYLSSGMDATIHKIGEYERQRTIWAIQKK